MVYLLISIPEAKKLLQDGRTIARSGRARSWRRERRISKAKLISNFQNHLYQLIPFQPPRLPRLRANISWKLFSRDFCHSHRFLCRFRFMKMSLRHHQSRLICRKSSEGNHERKLIPSFSTHFNSEANARI